MIYKISPNPSLPKRGKEGEDFAKEGKRKAGNGPLDYAKILNFKSQRNKKNHHKIPLPPGQRPYGPAAIPLFQRGKLTSPPFGRRLIEPSSGAEAPLGRRLARRGVMIRSFPPHLYPLPPETVS